MLLNTAKKPTFIALWETLITETKRDEAIDYLKSHHLDIPPDFDKEITHFGDACLMVGKLAVGRHLSPSDIRNTLIKETQDVLKHFYPDIPQCKVLQFVNARKLSDAIGNRNKQLKRYLEFQKAVEKNCEDDEEITHLQDSTLDAPSSSNRLAEDDEEAAENDEPAKKNTTSFRSRRRRIK